jgi:hypothetical protein
VSDVLDELRDNIRLLTIATPELNTERGANIAVKHALAMVDAFAEAHPGLVDETEPCDLCGKPMAWRQGVGFHVADSRPGGFSGNLCASCEKAVSDD